ncbi:uncharacterized protein TNIN_270711 [Trichonephila inaurata madagascariensis]|uniref:Uncharacterized protein n=1 Tax=Trichonephila inaurata madagascariensis TaxID=2747483 RepID=A0A8X6XEQ3_9ARAC|nr:uncharacterized protein TNIN_270711 [Trichonephila inaurata madagascariensis]
MDLMDTVTEWLMAVHISSEPGNHSELVALCTFVLLSLLGSSQCGITGHSGIVMHVNKYGHFSGHSSHYDYRFYPEKSLLDHLMEHHHSSHPYSAYEFLDEPSYHGEDQPLLNYYFQHDHMPNYHR